MWTASDPTKKRITAEALASAAFLWIASPAGLIALCEQLVACTEIVFAVRRLHLIDTGTRGEMKALAVFVEDILLRRRFAARNNLFFLGYQLANHTISFHRTSKAFFYRTPFISIAKELS